MSVLENRQSESAPGSSRSPEDRLDSWKAIASYLGRGVRTVQRWEREEGLPVHRLAHEKRGSVYAHKHEVDAWWESRRLTLASDTSVEVDRPAPPPVPERVTWSSAATFWPALSSDGRLLAYVSDGGRDGTSPQIWLQQLGGVAVCLTNGTRERSHLSFSADDTRLIFTARDDTGQNVYTMPTLGGEPRLLKRAAKAGRASPDGKWLAYIPLDQPGGIRIASLDDSTERTLATNLLNVVFAIWSPDSKHILVLAHPDSTIEPDYWIVAIDGREVANTGIVQRLRERGCWFFTLPAAWVGDSLVFSAIAVDGVGLWRQQLTRGTLQRKGDAERLTRGTERDCFPTAGGGRVAFVSTHTDQNLWSVALDHTTGMATGPLRRLTRGPGIVMHLSVSRDGRTLSYFLARRTGTGLMLRNLETDSEAAFAPEPPMDYGFQTISPSGAQLAYSAMSSGAKAMRPIFVASLSDGTSRKLGDDCGGRPRQWVDERFLLIERFGSRLNSVGVLDTVTGEQRDLLSSAELSITNPRVSPDGRWVAFDAARPGGPPSVFVARLGALEPVRQDDWGAIERSGSHPFWSADGRLLYYLPTIPSEDYRNVVRARRFDATSGRRSDESFIAFSSTEMVIPNQPVGAAPVATSDQIIFVLGDFRGDIWML